MKVRMLQFKLPVLRDMRQSCVAPDRGRVFAKKGIRYGSTLPDMNQFDATNVGAA